MDKKRMSWTGLCAYLIEYNKKHNITSKGVGPKVTVVAVIDQSSFKKEYPVEERSYRFTNHNKAFIPNNSSGSIFADTLTGSEIGVRLDIYVATDWKVEYCYIEQEEE